MVIDGEGSTPHPALRQVLERIAASLNTPGLVGLGAALFRSNERQWDAEDDSRAAPTDEERGALKRTIDDLNQRRTNIVNEIDDVVARWCAPLPGVPVSTEGLGGVVDRFTVLLIRTERLRASGPVDRAEVSAATAQVSQLERALLGLVEEVAAGRRRLPFGRIEKRYRAVPVRAAAG